MAAAQRTVHAIAAAGVELDPEQPHRLAIVQSGIGRIERIALQRKFERMRIGR